LRHIRFWVLAGVALAVCGGPVLSGATPPGNPAQKTQQPEIDPIVAAMLVKTAIIALQHANQTGNFTVLRDMGTPLFRERFDAAKLAALFSGLRARGINLSPVLMLSPNLEKPPEFKGRELRLIGNFPTQPLQIRYELVLLQLDGVWRIDGMAVDAVPNQAPQAAGANSSKAATAWAPKAVN
jgi:hypothetical protein